MGAFARDRAERKQWWDERLWLQLVLIAGWCFLVFLVIAGFVLAVVMTVVFVPVVYVVARWIIRRGH